jgi:hypothetical protein
VLLGTYVCLIALFTYDLATTVVAGEGATSGVLAMRSFMREAFAMFVSQSTPVQRHVDVGFSMPL